VINIRITKNVLSRSFEVRHKHKTYHINYTNSDGQTLALANRDHWEVSEEELEEINIYEFNNNTMAEREQ